MVLQKGIDLLLEACAPLLASGRMQLALVGSGAREFEQAARDLARAHPENCGVIITYNEGLAHRVEAGADAFLMPSRFEPCGLNQMYSLRYGTPPIVHATGGLVDTVIDTNAATLADGTATGFCFLPADSAALTDAIERALVLFEEPGQKQWRQIMRNGMQRDFGWSRSSAAYLEFYRELRSAAKA
jgi:starch synthase